MELGFRLVKRTVRPTHYIYGGPRDCASDENSSLEAIFVPACYRLARMTWAMWAHRILIALICAEGLLVLTSVDTLTIALKRPDQRTSGEERRVARGLFREFAGEFFVFVPVSVVLAMIVLRPFAVKISGLPEDAIDGLLGTVSYGFPYKTLKEWVLRATLKFMREAVDVADKEVLKDTEREEYEEEPHDD